MLDNIRKAKKQRVALAVCSVAALIISVACAGACILLILAENYLPMWFLLAICVAGIYAATFLIFAAHDRKTAMRLIDTVGSDISSEQTVADAMGWHIIAARKFIAKCKKWGIE